MNIRIIKLGVFLLIFLVMPVMAINHLSETIFKNGFENTANISSQCAQLYSNAGGYVPITAKTSIAPSNSAAPAKGVRFLEPNYGTCIARISDFANEPPVGHAVPLYSRMQAFNADSSFYMVAADDGFYHLYNTDDLSYNRILDAGGAGIGGSAVEPQWHPTDNNKFRAISNNGVGMNIYEYTITANASNDTYIKIADLTNLSGGITASGYTGSSINLIWDTAAVAFTADEGSPSADHRYWAFDIRTINFAGLGLVVYDLVNDSIVSVYNYATDAGGVGSPNNVSMSLTGNYVIAEWNPPNCNGSTAANGTFSTPCGMMSFNRQLTSAAALMNIGGHVDTAIAANGTEVIVSVGYTPFENGNMDIRDLATGQLINTLITSAWDGAKHYSGRAANKPGWIVVSSYGNTGTLWWHNKIFAVKLDDSGTVVILAHHRSTSADYWDQPHATVNRDLTRIVFGSNWGGGFNQSDSYMIEIPADALD